MNNSADIVRQRIQGLSDDELVRIVTVEAEDYQEEALAFAKEELEKRGVDPNKVTSSPDSQPVHSGTDESPPPALPQFLGFLASLRAAPNFPLTSIIGAFSIVLTMVWWIGGYSDWAFVTTRAFEYQPWRFLSSTFVHLGVLHLAFNVYWLWILGKALEGVLGWLRLGAVFVLLAVVSAAGEYAFFVGGVGLSGVVYGLFTICWVLSRSDQRFKEIVDRRTINIFVGWFFLCIITTAMGIWHVANVAHGVGAGAGILVGMILSAKSKAQRWNYVAMTAVSLLVVVLAATVGRPTVNLDPNGAVESGQRGYAALEHKDYRAATYWLRKATSYRRQHVEHWHNIGLAYALQDRHEESLNAFRHAHALVPSDSKAKEGLAYELALCAYAQSKKSKLQEARRLYEEALGLSPYNADWWHNLGLTYDHLGNKEEADKAFARSKELEKAAAKKRNRSAQAYRALTWFSS